MRHAVGMSGLVLVAATHLACTSSVFPHRVSLTTKSDGLPRVERIKPISVGSCARMVFVFPVELHSDEAMTDLLAEAKRVGGDSVVDVREEHQNSTMVLPFFVENCVALHGVAARSLPLESSALTTETSSGQDLPEDPVSAQNQGFLGSEE